jgi:hypothetical protein
MAFHFFYLHPCNLCHLKQHGSSPKVTRTRRRQHTEESPEKIHTTSQTPGRAVAQSVEALRYKPEGLGFDSPMLSSEFFVDIIISAALQP